MGKGLHYFSYVFSSHKREVGRFFPGKRGLRQEDPLSPYLFLLVMQGFTSLFHYTISAFHPRYKRLNITHLIFADDFVSLCAAEGRTFQISARGFD